VTEQEQTVCFDTSVFNALLDDEQREPLVSRILATTRPLITSLSMIEVIATLDEERRQSLMKRLSDGTRPLAMPNTLLTRATLGFGKTTFSMTLTVTEGDSQFWYLLDDPSSATKIAQMEALTWKNALEDSFHATHKRARVELQAIFSEKPADRPQSIAALFRYFKKHNQEIYKVVAKHYRFTTGKTLARAALWQLFASAPDWPLYLAAWGHELFARAISETNYGRRGKPGNLDLWAGAYLPYCDIFVTNDTGQGRGGQFRALRLLNRIVPVNTQRRRRARVLTYARFKAELLATEKT
jgi:hypothetical protein